MCGAGSRVNPGAGGGPGAAAGTGLTDVSYSTNTANALIHLYRAEVGKMTAYRQRLDMTTNWSVVTTAGLASFALGDATNSHATFLFAMFMNYFFLRLEARRFRTFEIAHHRVRIMERFFYPAMLGDKVDPGWHHCCWPNWRTAQPHDPRRRARLATEPQLPVDLHGGAGGVAGETGPRSAQGLDPGIPGGVLAGRHRQFSRLAGVPGGGRVLRVPDLAGRPRRPHLPLEEG